MIFTTLSTDIGLWIWTIFVEMTKPLTIVASFYLVLGRWGLEPKSVTSPKKKFFVDNFSVKAFINTETQENPTHNNVHDKGKTFS